MHYNKEKKMIFINIYLAYFSLSLGSSDENLSPWLLISIINYQLSIQWEQHKMQSTAVILLYSTPFRCFSFALITS